MTIKRFVAGFLFNYDFTRVVLIKKNKPDWMKGKWNAVGGHVEDGETPEVAMSREFLEEADIYVTDWKFFCSLHVPSHSSAIDFYYTNVSNKHQEGLKSMTDERVEIFPVNALPLPRIANVDWLIHMAISIQFDTTAAAFRITEFQKPT